MARKVTLDDSAILDAASAVFLERGIAATTAEIAERAGVSEGSLFKRWRTKGELFRAAMQHGMLAPGLDGVLGATAGAAPLSDDLVRIALASIDHLRVIVPLVMMHWSNPCDAQAAPEAPASVPTPVIVLRRFSSYFEDEMQRGRMRRTDAEVVARTFLGALWYFVQLEALYAAHGLASPPAEPFARGFVDLLLTGLETRDHA